MCATARPPADKAQWLGDRDRQSHASLQQTSRLPGAGNRQKLLPLPIFAKKYDMVELEHAVQLAECAMSRDDVRLAVKEVYRVT